MQISMETIENLCLKATSRFRGVRDVKARIRVVESGLEIMIRCGPVDGETPIPAPNFLLICRRQYMITYRRLRVSRFLLLPCILLTLPSHLTTRVEWNEVSFTDAVERDLG